MNTEQIDAAAKAIAQCMDYPWEHMPEQGRATMRKHAKTVLAAALPIDFKQATDQGGWQPIATAPKGWQSLLYSEKRACVVIDDWGDYDRHNQPKFTHWMPLPAAPTLLGVADGDAA